jgi:mannose-6-phosphate isomerase-like protein (cupin superfamily)
MGILASALIAPASLALAQSAVVDHTTQAQLLDKEKELKQAASGNGSASVKISDYPNHYTMLSYRSKTGGGEVHQNFADIFYIVHGDARLLTGGKLVNPTTASAGELRGTIVEGGSETPLHQGDFVHIPANVPHQLIIADGQDFYYFVIKVREQ